MKLHIRPLLLALLMLLLLASALNMGLQAFSSDPLEGGVKLAGDVGFSWPGWWDGSYQKAKELYYNDNIGFRPELVRTNNELDIRLFGKLHAWHVLSGKEGCLYEQDYIDSYAGKDFSGDGAICEELRKLRYIQDTLARTGKQLVFTFLPSKARCYPELFPEGVSQAPAAGANYPVMLRLCDSFGINTVDLNGWFLHIKLREQHPLFTKLGIHWARWAALRAADTFNRYLEGRLNIDIPDIAFGKDTATPIPKKGDDDINNALNLWWPATRETYYYNDTRFVEDSPAKQKPAVIFLGDSFFWTWAEEQIPQHCYRDWQFWFYFRDVYDLDIFSAKRPMEHIPGIDWMAGIRRCDALVIMLTEKNLAGIDTLFINEMYSRLGGK